MVSLPGQPPENPITPWPPDTPKESPVEIMVILGAIGIGFIVLKKNPNFLLMLKKMVILLLTCMVTG
jgi:hypothetical protein